MKKIQDPGLKNAVSGKKKSSITGLILFVCCVLSVSVAAASGGNDEAQRSIFEIYLWPVINFSVLVALLLLLLKKMDMKGYFQKRTELIEQTLREAREAKELAKKAFDEVEERLKLKDSEIENIIASAKLSGEKEKERLIKEGDKLKANILNQAKANIDFEVKNARAVIKAEAVEIAMELAEKKLKEKLTKEEQLKLLEESLTRIEGKN